MRNQQPYHVPISSWEVAPCLLMPPAAVGAVCMWWNLSFAPFLQTLALSCLMLFLLVAPPRLLRWTSVAVVLGSVFLLAASVSRSGA
jgi:hypothetical protein